MKTIALTTIAMILGLSTISAQDTTRVNAGQQTKPETNQRETGTQLKTGTIQGKSGTQGQTPVNKNSDVGNESGVQGETSTLQGKSGTQGQSTQGETSTDLEESAQQPASTTETPSHRDTQYTNEDKTGANDRQPSSQWRSEDRVVVPTAQVPESLRATLESPLYKGWEHSTIYRNGRTHEYMVEIRDGSNARIYYFDRQGKAIENRNDQ